MIPAPKYELGIPVCDKNAECCMKSKWEQRDPSKCRITGKFVFVFCEVELQRICAEYKAMTEKARLFTTKGKYGTLGMEIKEATKLYDVFTIVADMAIEQAVKDILKAGEDAGKEGFDEQ